MKEITISLTIPDKETAFFRFDDQKTILVGRDDACQVTVGHPAVARKLCRIWAEGDLVRVEEFPGLTNPITSSTGGAVCGGISGRSLHFSVGPVKMFIELGAPDGASQRPAPKSGGKSVSNPIVAYGGGAIALLLLLKLIWPQVSPAALGSDMFERLPESPIPEIGLAACDHRAMCKEKARLHYTRAMEILGRPTVSPAQKVKAIVHLKQSIAFETQAGEAAGAQVVAQAKTLEDQILADYRLQMFMLGQALRQKDRARAKQTAAHLASYLNGSSPQIAAWLEKIATN